MSEPDATRVGATVVITHRIRGGREGDYVRWLGEIGPLCRAAPGNLDWHVVRPVAGLTTTYTVIVRFDAADHLRAWMNSPDRARLVDAVRPLLAEGDRYAIGSGLDFWFASAGAATGTAGGAGPKVPVRWKQFLITWSAIYQLVLVVPLGVVPALRAAGAPDNRYIAMLFVSGIVVALMTYVVMPRYTRLARPWLYDGHGFRQFCAPCQLTVGPKVRRRVAKETPGTLVIRTGFAPRFPDAVFPKGGSAEANRLFAGSRLPYR